MSDKIKWFSCETKGGNQLDFFYNPKNDLLVIDLIAKDGSGGCELVRRTLDENKILGFLKEVVI